MWLNETLTLKGRIAIKNYISETPDDQLSWSDFNTKGFNEINMSEDDFIDGMKIFKKDLNLSKSETVPEEPKVEEPKVEEPKAEEIKAEEPKTEPAYTEEKPAEEIETEDGPESAEETVSTPTDAELEKEAEEDLTSDQTEVDFGNDVNAGIYKIAKTQWPFMYQTLLRCKKKMGAEFDFELVGEEVVNQRQLYTNNPYESSYGFKMMPFWGDPVNIPVYLVKITAKIKNNDWEIIAIVNKVPSQKGISITPINSNYEVPTKYYSYEKIECDHCTRNRDRVFGAIVYNLNTKEYRMVGKSCLKEYTGLDPVGILALSHVYNVARHWDPMPGGGKAKYYDVNDVLLIATAAIKLFGYVKPTYAGSTRWGGSIYEEDETCTRALVRNIYNHVYFGVPQKLSTEAEKVLNYIQEHLKELREESQKAKAHMATLDTENDTFKMSVKVALSGNLIVNSQLGLVCSFPQIYARFVMEDAKKKELAGFTPNNEFYPAQISDIVRIDDIYKIIKGKETSRGTLIVTILTKSGYEFTAFVMPSEIPEDVSTIGRVIGKVYRFNEFRGKKSTVLNNAKFVTTTDMYFSNGDEEPEKPLGEIKDKITIIPKEVIAGPEQSASFAWNQITYYSTLTIIDTLDHKFYWVCSNEDIYTHPDSLVGKKVTGAIKKIEKDIEGHIVSYTIGGHVKITESESNSQSRLRECHFAELPRNRNKYNNLIDNLFDNAINKVLDGMINENIDLEKEPEETSSEEQDLVDDFFARQTYEDELAYQAMLDTYEMDEDGFCDGFSR